MNAKEFILIDDNNNYGEGEVIGCRNCKYVEIK